jgi:hypothetical protein
MRSHGCRRLMVYCLSPRCHHHAVLDGDFLSDDYPVKALEHRMICTRCGAIGADVRPDWTGMTRRRGAVPLNYQRSR